MEQGGGREDGGGEVSCARTLKPWIIQRIARIPFHSRSPSHPTLRASARTPAHPRADLHRSAMA